MIIIKVLIIVMIFKTIVTIATIITITDIYSKSIRSSYKYCFPHSSFCEKNAF